MYYYLFCLLLLILLVLLCSFILVVTLDQSSSMGSKNFVNGKFHNKLVKRQSRSFIKIIKFIFTEKRSKWPRWIENTAKPRLQEKSDEVVITFINHATFLAEVQGVRILFDPIFSRTAGPIPWIGSNRKRHPGISIEELPHIDLILVSHNHYDHLDVPTLRKITKKFNSRIVVPLGNKALLERKSFGRVTELDWWQKVAFSELPGVVINLVPAQHFSGRGLFDGNKTLWGGFVVQHRAATLFHAGDTGYATHFKEIGDKFAIDLAMLPIGDFKPKWLMGSIHMGPEEALKAHRELKAKQSFAMHCETFPLSSVSAHEAEQELIRLREQEGVKNFSILQVGESYRFNE